MAHKVKQEEWEELQPADNAEVSVPADGEGRASASDISPRKRTPRKVPSSSPYSKSSRERKLGARAIGRSKPPDNSKANWDAAVSSASFFTLTYVFDVLRFALVMLRKPLSLIIVGYLLAALISHLHTTISATIHSTLVPLCQLPGVSRVAFCRVIQHGETSLIGKGGEAQKAVYPKLVDIQSTTFEQLLDDSVGGAGLALEIKKAEMATRDLVSLVRISHLTSRDRMADTLDTFVEDARQTGRGLQRFSAKVAGAVDRIIAVNDYALKRIEGAASSNSSPSLWRSILIPFAIHSSSTAELTSSFTQTMSVLETELHTLILAAEVSLHDLDKLEEQLNLLSAIVSREDDSLSTSKQELLSKLWTIVGGNRGKLRKVDSHLQLLGGLSEYRKRALAHVVGALQTLQAMSADLEELRGRMAQPELTASEVIPLEVHVRGIRAGLERLAEGRLKARKLEDAQYAKLTGSLEE